jgi:hypothetical protein
LSSDTELVEGGQLLAMYVDPAIGGVDAFDIIVFIVVVIAIWCAIKILD